MRKFGYILIALAVFVVAFSLVACNPDSPWEKPADVSKFVEGMDDFNYFASDDVVSLISPKDKNLKSVTIPACVTEINAGAFEDCLMLEEVKFEDESQLETVGTFAFKNCKALKTVSFPSSLRKIGDKVFSGCEKLESAEYDVDGVTSYGSRIFENCTSLKSIVVPASMAVTEAEFSSLVSLEEVELCEGVKSVGKNAFKDKKINSLYLPDSLETIGAYAFYGNDLSGSFEIPYGVTSIGEYAFYGNNFNGSFELPDTVVSVGDYAFYGHEFSALEFSSGLNSVGKGAFYSDKNSKLTSLRAPSVMRKNGGYAFEDFISQSALATVKSLDIESGDIEYKVLLPFSSLTKLQLGTSVDVKMGGFYGLDKLQSVKMPQSNVTVEEDGVSATCGFAGFFGFYQSENMMRVLQCYIEDESIESEYFTVPSSLTKVEITLPHIGAYAFENMTELTDIIVPDSSTIAFNALDNTGWYNKQEDGVLCIAKTAYGYKGTTPRELTIPKGVQKIQPYAFAFRPVQSVVLPSSLTEFDRTSFYVSYIKEISFSENNSKFKAIDNCLLQGSKVIFGVGGNIPSKNGTRDVTEIGDEAFAHTSVVTVTIPDTITKIGKSAFENSSLASVTFGADSKLATIGERAFFGTKVATVAIPDSVASIEESAFENSNVATVTFGADSKMTSVGDKAFYNTRLESINIPKKLSKIGVRAFASGNLNSVSVDSENETFKAINNCLVKGQTVVLGTSGSTIPTTYENVNDKKVYDVMSIGDYAFANVKITNISIPSHITSIGAYAFDESGIVSITFETRLEKSDENDGEHTAQKLDLQTIGEGAFANCLNLESIIVPYSVKTIEKSLFAGSGLKEIVFAPYTEKVEWAETDADGQTVNKTKTISEYYLETIKESAFEGLALDGVTIPYSVKTIEKFAFKGSGIQDIVFATCVKEWVENQNTGNELKCREENFSELQTIGEGAFENCLSLHDVAIPYSVKAIGNTAFKNSGVNVILFLLSATTKTNKAAETEVVEESNLADIGNNAFEGTYITSVELPASVKNIGSYAFKNVALQEVSFGESLESIGDEAFLGSSITNLVIPSLVKNIGTRAFANLVLESLTFQTRTVDGRYIYDLQTVAQNAFENCTLQHLAAPAGAFMKIRAFFADIDVIDLVGEDEVPSYMLVVNNDVNNYQIVDCDVIRLAEGIKKINDYAFAGCAMTSFELPSTVAEVGKAILLGCPVENLSVASGNTKYFAINNYIVNRDNHAIVVACGESKDIPTSYTNSTNGKVYDVSAIADEAFSGLSSLRKITIPSNVKTIGKRAFYKTGLQEVVFANGVESIGEEAFLSSSNLSSVTIPDSVKTIAERAFEKTAFFDALLANKDNANKIIYLGKVAYMYNGTKTGVKELVIADGTITIAKFALKGMSDLRKITLPSSLKRIEAEAFAGCGSLTNIYFNNTREAWKVLEKEKGWTLNLPVHKVWTLCQCANKNHDHDGDGQIKGENEALDKCTGYVMSDSDICDECLKKDIKNAMDAKSKNA